MADPGLFIYILLMLAEAFDRFVKLLVKGHWFEKPTEGRSLLLAYGLSELCAEQDYIQVCVRQSLGETLMFLSIVYSFVVTCRS